MTYLPEQLDPSVPKPLQDLVRAVVTLFPDKVEIKLVPLLVFPGESGVDFIPRNDRAASVFCMYDGVENDDSFYISAGSIYSADFHEAAEAADSEASEWALELINSIARFGLLKISNRKVGRWLRRTDIVVPQSQAELDSISLGANETMKVHFEPW